MGSGWYADSDSDLTYDDYNAWVILPHQMLNFYMGQSDSQAQTVIPDTGGRGRAEISPGMLRRLVRLHINHYLANGAIDPSTFELLPGQTPESASETQETYITPGSNFWSMYLFGALWLLPSDDRFWTVPEEALPSEQFESSSWFEIPAMLVRNHAGTAHADFPGVLRTVHEQSTDSGTARVSTLIFSKARRTHASIESPTGSNTIRDGGYALGHGPGETPPVATTGEVVSANFAP